LATYPHPSFNWTNVNVAFDDFIVVPNTDVISMSTVSNPQVTVTTAAVIVVDSAVTNPTVNVSSFVTGGTGTLPSITIISDLADVAIPASTVVTGTDWNGILVAPTVTTVPAATLPEGSGRKSNAISVGFSGATLTFSKGVRLSFPNEKGNRVGYSRNGGAFTEITDVCSADTQEVGNALTDGTGNCKISVGDDLVVWTKHFTDFAAFGTSGNVTTSAAANNVAPVASSTSIDSGAGSITLSEYATKDVVVTADVTDNNGCQDITGASVKLFRTSAGSTGDNDASIRYTQAATVVDGSCTGGTDLTSSWTATIPVQYYAEAAGWTAEVTPTDGTAGTVDSDTITMATMTALNVTASIAYGELALGANTGTSDQTTTVTNTGNVVLTSEVNSGASTAMTCGIGTIPVGNERYSSAEGAAYATGEGSKAQLSATAATVTGFSVAKATATASPTTGGIYWGLGMPADGISGTCSGTVVFTATTPS
jgi:hypothetical protein